MIEMLAENFRANMKRRRAELGLTQAAIAERMGVTKAYVAQLEASDHAPTTTLIERVAQAMGCNPLALLQSPVETLVSQG